MTDKKEVVILGGGFAGLAAGVELSSKGHHVTIIEKRGHLGGRAYSFKDPTSGEILDNGQHILMGCYKDTFDFLKKIGTDGKVALQKNLTVDFSEPQGVVKTFRALPLPSPLHLLGGFLTFRGLKWRDRLSVFKMRKVFGGKKSKKSEDLSALDRQSITEWLRGMGQSEEIREKFWDPLVLAALNDRPEISSAALFYSVLQEALFSGRKGSCIGLPTVGLSELYADPARDFIERKGGHFLLKSPVLKLHFRGPYFQEVELEGGRRLSAECLLSTVPFTALKKILPESMLYEDPFFAPLSHLGTSPIVAVHLWFDRPVLDRAFVGLWKTKVHWVFNRRMNLASGASDHLSLVISGARDELHTPAPQLIETAMKELTDTFPEVARARLMRATVSKEPEATMAPTVGSSAFRLPQKTPYPNFFLAGDWTDTGLPATIESAVRSAYQAVSLIEATA